MGLKDLLAKKLPPLYQSKFEKPKMVKCKFYIPGTIKFWFPMEFDGKDTFFGLVINETEVKTDYFTFSELEKIRGPFDVEVGIDMDFKPTALSEVLKGVSMIR